MSFRLINFKSCLFLFLSHLVIQPVAAQLQSKPSYRDLVPPEYVVFDRVFGDLNKDGIEDCILIIKATDSANIVQDEVQGRLDRNRRGILVLLNKNNRYEVVSRNYQCFSSEQEDGGVYFPPELSVEIKKGNLYLNYAHGRYGSWQYIFRYQQNDIYLIGFNQSTGGAVIEKEVSVNYMTKKMVEKVNTNKRAKGGDEIFKETWKSIAVTKLTKLSEVEDFDSFLNQ